MYQNVVPTSISVIFPSAIRLNSLRLSAYIGVFPPSHSPYTSAVLSGGFRSHPLGSTQPCTSQPPHSASQVSQPTTTHFFPYPHFTSRVSFHLLFCFLIGSISGSLRGFPNLYSFYVSKYIY